MIYNEAYDEHRKIGKALLQKWDKALNADGGITDPHSAMTTAVLLENYLTHLNSDPRLIAEDRITTGAFTGINLALMGLIRRTIPELIGAELVGIQAMPTPTAPIFTLTWHKDDSKGTTTAADELWVSPIPVNEPLNTDPWYTSEHIRQEDFTPVNDATALDLVWGNSNKTIETRGKAVILSNSMYLQFLDADSNILGELHFAGAYSKAATDINSAITANSPAVAGTVVTDSGGSATTFGDYDVAVVEFNDAADGGTRQITITGGAFWPEAIDGVTVATTRLEYEYVAEGEGQHPEVSFQIASTNISVIRRQLKGKYTVDSAYDLKTLHGINLDTELVNMMKTELMFEINKEIISDLRAMAFHYKELDFNAFTGPAGSNGVTIAGNYDDAHKLMLDAISQMCATIWNIGRMGYANWVVGNPSTLAFLDRVSGFVGSGVNYTGRSLKYMGSLGGQLKFYSDPTYPKNELLIGYKGSGALDAGYLHCPYLPITATPTIIDQETGDPSKIFYTRYGKTWSSRGAGGDLSQPLDHILMGKYQYGRLLLKNVPELFV